MHSMLQMIYEHFPRELRSFFITWSRRTITILSRYFTKWSFYAIGLKENIKFFTSLAHLS